MAAIIQLRRGNSVDWDNNNPTLAEGEMGVELDTGKFKVGNGVLVWKQLPYASGIPGKDGTKWYTGSLAPESELGNPGDFYLDRSSGYVYEKGEVWSFLFNITGSRGGGIAESVLNRLSVLENATGQVELDFRKMPSHAITQGDGDLEYVFLPLTPKNFFAGWDSDIWEFNEGEYPRLRGF